MGVREVLMSVKQFSLLALGSCVVSGGRRVIHWLQIRLLRNLDMLYQASGPE